MRRTWAGLLALTLAVPFLWADDKPKLGDDQAKADTAKADAAKPKTPVEQFQELVAQYDKEFNEIVTSFRGAKDAAAQKEVRDKAFKLPAGYAAKIMALVEKHPKDPVAAEALMWVATAAASRGLPAPPQAKEATDRLLRDYIDDTKIGQLAMVLVDQDGGEKTIRMIREKTKNLAVKAQAGFALASSLRESDDQTEAKAKETEAILAEIVANLKDGKGLPEDFKDEVTKLLDEVRLLSIGKTAPNAESEDLEGKAVTLSDYKGKVVVLDFWATWCGPCRGMIPHERELVKKHEGKPFVFVSVSADRKIEDLKKFLETEKMPWVHWWAGGKGSVVEKWFIKAFPTIYILDSKGVIRARIVGGGDDNEKKLNALVDKLVKEAEGKS